MNPAFTPLREALDRAADAGRTIRVWLRDDDCVAPTPVLDRLAGLCDGVGLPVLLAVIPESAEAALAGWIAAHPGFAPCQHGWSHANHARPGERNIELGGARPTAEVLRELAQGRARLHAMFGSRLSDILVPPWNRIDPALLPHLADLGFSELSTIAPSRLDCPIPRLDCDLDIMDWRHGRIGKSSAEVTTAAATIVLRQERLGILTHHLVHDEGAWTVLGGVIACLAHHPACAFATAVDLSSTASVAAA